jgi:hypothetical protein
MIAILGVGRLQNSEPPIGRKIRGSVKKITIR